MEREKWLDAAKGLAIILVVLGHCLNHFDNGSFQRLCEIIYLFHMPLFVFLSGYSFCWVVSHNSFGRNILCNTAIYVIQSVVYICFNIAVQNFISTSNHYSAQNLVTFPVIPVGHFWYLQAMIIYYLIFWLYERFIGNTVIRRVVEAVTAMAVFFANRLCDNIIMVRICYFILFFAAGYFAHLFVISRNITLPGKDMKGGIISYIGVNSLWIYIFHPYVTSAIRAILNLLHISDPYTGLAIMLASAVAFPLVLRLVMQKTNTAWIVTNPAGGLRQED